MTGRMALAVAALVACEPSPPVFTEALVLGGVRVEAAELNAGQKLFMMHCASCHGVDGSGRGPAARHLDPGPRDFRSGSFAYKSTPGDELPTDADILQTLRNGVVRRGMPAWSAMRDEDLKALVSFIKTFSPRWREGSAGDPATAPSE